MPEQGGAEKAGRLPVPLPAAYCEGGTILLQQNLEFNRLRDDAATALEPNAATAAHDIFWPLSPAWS